MSRVVKSLANLHKSFCTHQLTWKAPYGAWTRDGD